MTDFRDVGARVSNWGRWGADDERGTLNLITPERVLHAATELAKTGQVFELGVPLGSDGPQRGPDRINPVHLMSQVGVELSPGAFRVNDDYIFMPLQAASQYDALSHVYYDGQLYNGFDAKQSVDSRGARHCSIDRMGAGVVARGVLLDVARSRGVETMAAGDAISAAELQACADEQGVEIRPGDVVAVRTGWWAQFTRTRDRAAFFAGEPGLAFDCVEWLHAKDVAVIAADNWAVEVLPGSVAGEILPFHMVAIRDVGLLLAEMLDFDELATACAADGRYEFLYVGQALKFTAAVGSPVNPLAIR